MNRSEIFKRWTATLITIPVSVIFLLTGFLSTGFGHGTGLILALYYAPISALHKFPISLPEYIIALVFVGLLCALPVCYAVIVDTIKYHRMGIVFYLGLLSLHYWLFYLDLWNAFEQEQLNKSFSIYPGLLIFAIVIFALWQIGLLLIIVLQRYYSLTAKNV